MAREKNGDTHEPESSETIQHPKISDPEQIRRMVEDRVKAEQDENPPKDCASGSSEGNKNDRKFILDCLNANELGDGEIFKRLFRDQFLFNQSMGRWLIWTGHHWQEDLTERASAAVERVAEKYIEELYRISADIRQLNSDDPREASLKNIRKKLQKRIDAIRTARRRANCLTYAHSTDDDLTIKGDEIDQAPLLLACPNGVVELKTGGFRDGRQNDFLIKSSNIEWRGINEPCALWKRTLLEIADGDQELVDFEQRLYGYSIIGGNPERVFVVLDGAGWNGKTLKTRVLGHVLGDYVGPIQSELLLLQRFRSSSAPSPDIMALRGLRMAFASETDDGARFSASAVKWLTGSDELVGRYPHDRLPTKFQPQHTLFLLTNNKPSAPGGDYAFWKRMVLIPHKLSFVQNPMAEHERKMDPYLFEKLQAEASGILAWLVKGCLFWQKEGLKPPACVTEAVAEYQKEEDIFGMFIETSGLVVIGENLTVGASDFYEVFCKWYREFIGKFPPSQKKFGSYMTRCFRKERSKVVFYAGVGLLSEE